jgi:hypothetical protein
MQFAGCQYLRMPEEFSDLSSIFDKGRRMDVKIQFTNQTICGSDFAPSDGVGAVVEFRGIVRGVEREAKSPGSCMKSMSRWRIAW